MDSTEELSFHDKLTKAPNREHVISECCALIDAEVKSKGGISGIAVKGAYGVVKAVKPRFVTEVVDGMLDDWVAHLEPFWQKWQKDPGGKNFGEYLQAQKDIVAEELLQVTDGKAKNAKNGSVKKLYEKMRPSAKRHVEEALPRLGAMVEKEAQRVPEAPKA
jgi:hypothetical protein